MIKIAQFGEGGFLRGFVDWMFDKIGADVTVIQPIQNGMIELLKKQEYKYNLLLRGMENGKKIEEQSLITCIKDGINPYTEWDKYINLAKDKELLVVVSNTTESGIEYVEQDVSLAPNITFPAKLTLFLKSRFESHLDGLIILPCELIDNNGDELKKCVLKYAKLWSFSNEFVSWIETKNTFSNTLVDRIVTGYPKDMDTKGDNMFDTAEIFHLWVIEGNFEKTLPLQKAGFNVVWADDVTPYKKRKVRILNGAHTSLVPYAMLKGFKTVGQCIADDEMKEYIKKCVFDEIIPTLDLPKEELESYANSVLERFSNPYIEHQLSSIALNSFDKFRVRVMPSILEYKNRFGEYPATLMQSFYALCDFYKTDMANDSPEIIEFMKTKTNDEIWSELCK